MMKPTRSLSVLASSSCGLLLLTAVGATTAANAQPSVGSDEVNAVNHMMMMDTSTPPQTTTTMSGMQHDCLADPTNAQHCGAYVYPHTSAYTDMLSLCGQGGMPFMVACSLMTSCLKSEGGVYYSDYTAAPPTTIPPAAAAPTTTPAGGGMPMAHDRAMHVFATTTKPECNLWSLLSTTCVHDNMGGMKGCANYKKLCNVAGTVVPGCVKPSSTTPSTTGATMSGGGHAMPTTGPTMMPSTTTMMMMMDRDLPPRARSFDKAADESSTIAGPMLTFLPTTRTTSDAFRGICDSHYMSGCDACTFSSTSMMNFPTNGCDLLVTYASLCLAMPSMSDCIYYDAMCAYADANGLAIVQGYCPSGAGEGSSAIGDRPPVMNMFFFNDNENFYLLFKKWIPRTRGEYVGAWFAIFFMGIAVEVCSLGKAWIESIFTATRVERRKRSEKQKAKKKAAIGDGEAKVVSRSNAPDKLPSNDNGDDDVIVASGDDDGTADNFSASADADFVTRAAVAILNGSIVLRIALDVCRLLTGLITTFGGYLLMLAAMCFNVGIFAAVIVGLAVGNVACGYWRPLASSAIDEERLCHCS